MLQIKKLRPDPVIDFAAEELKKYLRMMMPAQGEIAIVYEPEAKDGFRLGLLEEFGLPFEGEDPKEDDVIHIDTQIDGGILAGSNSRSVLFAVYRFCKLNGCRFLFPGAEGEYIPKKPIEPQNYHKLADHRYRGHALEGDPSLEQVLMYIDFHAKEELNSFGNYGIHNYQRRYYRHELNEENRFPEELDFDLADTQWRALYECEIKKRGLRLHAGGHSLLPKALGLNIADRFLFKEGKKEFPQDVIPYLAQLNGKRGLNRNDIFYTNVCMSNPEVRRRIVAQAVKNVEANRQSDLIGMSMADTSHNHCECEQCQTKRPSDWWVMILNEVDEELTRKGIDNKLSFSFYVDSIFAPVVERIKNPDRFMFTFCPISRTYTSSIQSMDNLPEPIPYVRNGWEVPKTVESLYALLKEWQKVFPGPCSVYEYHFWTHQYRDPGMMAFSRRIYEDVMSYRPTGMNGCMQDGSNKSFFPNGFHGHIYAEALMNRDCDYEAELEDYFTHFYGKDWKKAKRYLESITEAFDYVYMNGEKSADLSKGVHYNPAQVAKLSEVKELAAGMRELALKHVSMPVRPQVAAWRILLRHTDYCEGLAEVMIEKCQGHNKYALALLQKFFREFGKYDFEIERWLDFGLCARSINVLVKKLPTIEL